MAITAEETEFLDRLTASIEKLIDVESEARDIFNIWDARNYSSQIDITDITDYGAHGFSTAQLANAITYLSDLTDFLDNAAVSTLDRRDVLDKVRKIAP